MRSLRIVLITNKHALINITFNRYGHVALCDARVHIALRRNFNFHEKEAAPMQQRQAYREERPITRLSCN